jgi:hypothetical protein
MSINAPTKTSLAGESQRLWQYGPIMDCTNKKLHNSETPYLQLPAITEDSLRIQSSRYTVGGIRCVTLYRRLVNLNSISNMYQVKDNAAVRRRGSAARTICFNLVQAQIIRAPNDVRLVVCAGVKGNMKLPARPRPGLGPWLRMLAVRPLRPPFCKAPSTLCTSVP